MFSLFCILIKVFILSCRYHCFAADVAVFCRCSSIAYFKISFVAFKCVHECGYPALFFKQMLRGNVLLLGKNIRE